MICIQIKRPHSIYRYLVYVASISLIIFICYRSVRPNRMHVPVHYDKNLKQPKCLLDWNPTGVDISSYENTRRHFTASRNTENAYRQPRVNSQGRKFLLPVLHFGPNNQLMGFRESIFVTMYLNRTIVIPTFLKHRTDT